MRLHESIEWALHAQSISALMLPERRNDYAGLRGLVGAMIEGNLQLSVKALLEQIELDLKERLTAFMKRARGASWWAMLPPKVQKIAATRHHWSAAQLGPRAVTRYPDVAWLTMGDVVVVLESLSVADWRICLHAETRRRREFRTLLYRIKGFRDYHVAHPKPHRTSTLAIRRLCGAVRRVPLTLRPSEWRRASLLLDAVRRLPIDERRMLHEDASVRSNSHRARLVRTAAVIPVEADGYVAAGRVQRPELTWRTALLRSCATYDTSGRLFFALGA